jgi:hypothetical protein
LGNFSLVGLDADMVADVQLVPRDPASQAFRFSERGATFVLVNGFARVNKVGGVK